MRKLRPHRHCQKPIKQIKLGRTSKSRDDLVYTYDSGEYLLLKVEEIDGQRLHFSEINCTPKIFSRHEDIPFGLVGVFRDFGKRNVFHDINVNDIQGKLVRTRGLIMTIPKNVLIQS